MNLDPDRFQDMSKREILREFIEHVATSEEEHEEKEHRSGSSTDLNLYLLDNQGYEIGSLDDHINHITESPHVSGYAKNHVEDHTFSEDHLRDDVAIVHITTPEKSRVDDSMWIGQGEYIWVLTTERQEWRTTIENLIKYLPKVERLFLSSEYLEALTDEIEDASVSGFTARYKEPHEERKATLRFHGGRKEDMKKAERHFNAKPTRIEFDQTNSPTAAIEAAGTNEGRLSFQSVVQGSQEKAVETLLNVSEDYQELDEASFKIDRSVGVESLENGFAVDGFVALELTNPDRDDSSSATLLEDLTANILNSTRYSYGKRGDDTLRVYDSHHEEFFDLAVEPPDIVIYPRDSTTALSLRTIVQEIYEYDSTYSLEKVENAVSAF
jgi:hypothetical protein